MWGQLRLLRMLLAVLQTALWPLGDRQSPQDRLHPSPARPTCDLFNYGQTASQAGALEYSSTVVMGNFTSADTICCLSKIKKEKKKRRKRETHTPMVVRDNE